MAPGEFLKVVEDKALLMCDVRRRGAEASVAATGELPVVDASCFEVKDFEGSLGAVVGSAEARLQPVYESAQVLATQLGHFWPELTGTLLGPQPGPWLRV